MGRERKLALDGAGRDKVAGRATRGRRAGRRVPHRLAPWTVLVVGLSLACGAFAVRERTMADDREAAFTHDTEAVVASLESTMRGYESVLRNMRDLFASGQPPTTEAYDAYVRTLLLTTRFPGIFGTAWTYRVPADQVQAFVEQTNLGAPPEPELAPTGARGDSYVITHAAPDDTIGIARGVDARLFPPIAEALEEARDDGDIRLGPRFQIPVRNAVESNDQRPVTAALVLPVYRDGPEPETRQERRDALVGWAGIIVDARAFLATGAGEHGPALRIDIYDGEETETVDLMASSREEFDPAGRTRVAHLDLYGRRWTVELREVDAPQSSTPVSLAIGGAIALITLLVFALILVISRSERRALRMVDEATEELSLQERHFRALVANSTDLITVSDREGRLRFVSPSIEGLLGYREDELLGTDVFALIHPDDRPGPEADGHEALVAADRIGPLRVRIRHATTGWRDFETIGVNLFDDPAVAGFVFNSRDVTERRAYEENLALQATHDALTGLPNRALFLDRLAQAFARAERSGGNPAVLFLDLDRFKAVNDSFGHAAGDEFLVQVGERLRQTVRPQDTVARLGGDEFVVLAEGAENEDECRAIADRIAAAFTEPFVVGGREIFATASIGISIAGARDVTPGILLRDADAAMYQAKQQGRARSVMFHGDRSATDRLSLAPALREAIGEGTLALDYQPVIDLATATPVGVEALLRWHHPERGPVAPEEVLAIARDCGLAVPLCRWVLGEATRQGCRWAESLPPGQPFTVGVNVSARELVEPDFVAAVARALAESGLPPEALCLEIAEDALTQDLGRALETLDALARTGVSLSIDDFGTGTASLALLKRLPVGSLKIDRSFVHGLGHDQDDTLIVAAVISLAHSLGVRAVAEGVETEAQRSELAKLGCDAAQGWLIGGPAPAAEIAGLLLPAPAAASS